MRLTINHVTTYHYAQAAAYALQQLRIRPQASDSQTVHDWNMELSGARHQASFIDQHGNLVDLVEALPGATEVSVMVSGEIETHDTKGVVGPHTLAMPLWFYLRQTSLTTPGKRVKGLVGKIDNSGSDSLSILHTLSKRIREDVSYQTGTSDVETTAEDSLKRGSGVCQDHAHVFMSAARLMGYPARYVSGYLMMNDRIDQEASHAWAEAHVDGLGWVGFDISNVISPDERYVHIARGLDYSGAAPTTGFVVGAGQENLVVSLQVQQ